MKKAYEIIEPNLELSPYTGMTVPITPTITGRQLVSNRPWVCEVSPNGKFLAIGNLDEMSGVAVYGL